MTTAVANIVTHIVKLCHFSRLFLDAHLAPTCCLLIGPCSLIEYDSAIRSYSLLQEVCRVSPSKVASNHLYKAGDTQFYTAETEQVNHTDLKPILHSIGPSRITIYFVDGHFSILNTKGKA
jgi:hypothetical protein